MYTSVIIKYNQKTTVVSFAHIKKRVAMKDTQGKKRISPNPEPGEKCILTF